jgi:L-aspartate oxidase
MAAGAGLTRDAASLERARDDADAIGASGPLALRRAARAASLICRSALERTESRGVHYRNDHPEPLPEWADRHVAYRND